MESTTTTATTTMEKPDRYLAGQQLDSTIRMEALFDKRIARLLHYYFHFYDYYYYYYYCYYYYYD